VSELDGLRITRVSLQRSEGAARPARRA